MARKQLNVRIDEDTLLILDAAAWSDEVSIGELVRPYLEALAASRESDPAVQDAIRSRKAGRAAREQKVGPDPDQLISDANE